MENRFSAIKIFGERNTSTGALKLLVERNSKSRVLPSTTAEVDPRFDMAMVRRLAPHSPEREAYLDSCFRDASPRHSWKHAATIFPDISDFADCLVALTFRHPASWLLALHRRPYHALAPVPPKLADFVTAPWMPVARDRLGTASLTPAGLYNAKAAAAIGFARQLAAAGYGHVTVRFEDFAVDQVAVMERMRPHLLDLASIVTPIEASTKDPSKRRADYRAYYGDGRWVKDIPEDAARVIDAAIDWAAVASLGYRPVADMIAEMAAGPGAVQG